jgi:hypothetical protein
MSKVVKPVVDVVEGVTGVVTAPFSTPDIGKAIREQEARAEQQAAEQKAEVAKMEEEERRKRRSSLRGALEPRTGLFDLLGSSQRRGTLG